MSLNGGFWFVNMEFGGRGDLDVQRGNTPVKMESAFAQDLSSVINLGYVAMWVNKEKDDRCQSKYDARYQMRLITFLSQDIYIMSVRLKHSQSDRADMNRVSTGWRWHPNDVFETSKWHSIKNSMRFFEILRDSFGIIEDVIQNRLFIEMGHSVAWFYCYHLWFVGDWLIDFVIDLFRLDKYLWRWDKWLLSGSNRLVDWGETRTI